MSKEQAKPHVTTANYISIVLLMMVAFSGTLYLIFYAVNKPPFDLELAIKFATKNGVQCVSTKLTHGNIPHEVVEFDEKKWVVLEVIEDKKELQSIMANACAALIKHL